MCHIFIGILEDEDWSFLQVSLLIRKQLIDRARDFNIILDDVSLTELSFGKEYAAAVEAKQIAQQEAQRAAYLVEKAKQEKQQKIVQAEGEATAALMLGNAISKNPGYLKLRSPQVFFSFGVVGRDSDQVAMTSFCRIRNGIQGLALRIRTFCHILLPIDNALTKIVRK